MLRAGCDFNVRWVRASLILVLTLSFMTPAIGSNRAEFTEFAKERLVEIDHALESIPVIKKLYTCLGQRGLTLAACSVAYSSALGFFLSHRAYSKRLLRFSSINLSNIVRESNGQPKYGNRLFESKWNAVKSQRLRWKNMDTDLTARKSKKLAQRNLKTLVNDDPIFFNEDLPPKARAQYKKISILKGLRVFSFYAVIAALVELAIDHLFINPGSAWAASTIWETEHLSDQMKFREFLHSDPEYIRDTLKTSSVLTLKVEEVLLNLVKAQKRQFAMFSNVSDLSAESGKVSFIVKGAFGANTYDAKVKMAEDTESDNLNVQIIPLTKGFQGVSSSSTPVIGTYEFQIEPENLEIVGAYFIPINKGKGKQRLGSEIGSGTQADLMRILLVSTTLLQEGI